MNEIETTIETTTPTVDSFAEAVAAAMQVEAEARAREGIALEVLAEAEEAYQVALAEAGLQPDDAAIRLALDAARRAYDRADAAAGIAEAGVKEATRRLAEAEALEHAAELRAERWAAYCESVVLLEKGSAVTVEFTSYLTATAAALGEWDARFRDLEAEAAGIRSRGGAPPRFEPPSSWPPIWRSLLADLERLQRLYQK
jgi:hypothetical protein